MAVLSSLGLFFGNVELVLRFELQEKVMGMAVIYKKKKSKILIAAYVAM